MIGKEIRIVVPFEETARIIREDLQSEYLECKDEKEREHIDHVIKMYSLPLEYTEWQKVLKEKESARKVSEAGKAEQGSPQEPSSGETNTTQNITQTTRPNGEPSIKRTKNNSGKRSKAS